MASVARAEHFRQRSSTLELVKDLTHQTSTLVHQEVELVKLEVRENVELARVEMTERRRQPALGSRYSLPPACLMACCGDHRGRQCRHQRAQHQFVCRCHVFPQCGRPVEGQCHQDIDLHGVDRQLDEFAGSPTFDNSGCTNSSIVPKTQVIVMVQ